MITLKKKNTTLEQMNISLSKRLPMISTFLKLE